jgi:UDP-N-acetylmuramyl pentapeptide phosphotransferase/UDP-N-acetylglucosamine-1-phosphate transferase
MWLLLISFATSVILTGFVIRYQHLHNHLSGDHDFAGPQKFHTAITPRIGGTAIWVSITIPILYKWVVTPDLGSLLFLTLVASLPVFVTGVAEDLTKSISIKIRLMAGFLSGLIFLFLFDITTMRFGFGALDLWLNHPWFVVLFLAIGVAGVSNAYNIIDGFNGLASMVAIISALAMAYVALKVGDPLVLNLAFILVGAIAGFFLWNYPRGLIFLGDGGAYLIGFGIACLSILLVARNPSVSPWFAILVNAYPIFETLFTIWRRSFHQGRNPGLPDGAHFHSLIYRRIMRWAHPGNQSYWGNAKTSPYLWLLSSLGVIPALLWWDSTLALMISAVVFVLLYNFTYRQIVTFRTPSWLGRPPRNR